MCCNTGPAAPLRMRIYRFARTLPEVRRGKLLEPPLLL
jgi:hypothetical protein